MWSCMRCTFELLDNLGKINTCVCMSVCGMKWMCHLDEVASMFNFSFKHYSFIILYFYSLYQKKNSYENGCRNVSEIGRKEHISATKNQQTWTLWTTEGLSLPQQIKQWHVSCVILESILMNCNI